MISNYFRTAFRIYTRNKVFTAINVLGLSVGISAALIIFLIVQFEYSYDKAAMDGDRIYRVVLDFQFNGNRMFSAAVPAPLSTAVPGEVTGVESVIPVMQFQGDATADVRVKRDAASAPVVFKKQPNIVFTGPQYFSFLPFEWIAGTPAASLKDPFQVVLTESRARQYFPSANVRDIVGRQLQYNDDITVTVTGVVKDLDARTSLGGVEFISFATIAQTHLQRDFMMDVWDDWMAYSQVYIKLAKGSNATLTKRQLNALLNKYNKKATRDEANYVRFNLQPLSDVHFNSRYAGVGQRLAHEPTLRGLLAIAAFLLLLACINFINLSTANASQRAKEIGVRKTMGGSRWQLISQFLGETFLLTLLASLVSFFLAPLLLHLFADYTPPGLAFRPFSQPYIFAFLLGLSVLVSLLSGLYPAFILSGYKPVNVLKDQLSRGTRHAWIRKSLTVSQFVIAQFFVIATVIVSKQISYALHADIGFRKDAVLSFSVPNRDTLMSRRTALLTEISALPGVQEASRGFLTPAAAGASFASISYAGAGNDNREMVQLRWGDTSYLQLFNIKLLAGRNIEESDTIKEFVINETYARHLGFESPADAVGQQLDFNGMKMPIVGVMRDFHTQSFHGALGPVVFAGCTARSYQFHVLLRPQGSGSTAWAKTIAAIQQAYHRRYPAEEFSYSFLDDTIARFYQAEQRTAGLLKWATGLCVLISCLGLLGLVMYTIHTRTKEIGVRKILGATVLSIVSLLSRDFVRLVLIAFALAAPLAWWATNKWLEGFAYRTAMNWWVFALCGLSMLLVALGTLGLQITRAAVNNPVKSLRRE
ncbi:ABC transporter permease [uncultured Chitinophaga sp.]|jgi:ABC-type antimicrobial peptide transport system, permease component|uniref:ABC transporter permease n=1 Tax=uncultured Chitinophaga sp. TaxID=339340 RepID=UPI0026231D3B|nr:ABC transporter permease [uncultured Chitinophaga sp.]